MSFGKRRTSLRTAEYVLNAFSLSGIDNRSKQPPSFYKFEASLLVGPGRNKISSGWAKETDLWAKSAHIEAPISF